MGREGIRICEPFLYRRRAAAVFGGSDSMGRVFYCPKTDRYQDYVFRRRRRAATPLPTSADTLLEHIPGEKDTAGEKRGVETAVDILFRSVGLASQRSLPRESRSLRPFSVARLSCFRYFVSSHRAGHHGYYFLARK